MSSLLIRNGAILSMDEGAGDLDRGDVLIEDSRIAEIGPDLDAPGAEVVDASGMIVMPGLIDAHLHTWQTGIRGIAGDWTLTDYGRNMHAGLATSFDPEDIYIATLVGALNQINSGVTTLFDWSHNNPTPAHSDRAIDGLLESGIRAVYGHGTPKPQLNEAGVPIGEHLHPEDEVKRIREERLPESEDALVSLALCIRGPDLSSYEATAHDIRLARKYGVIASCHIGGRIKANCKTPDGIHRLAKDGLLGPDFNSVHSNKLEDEELRLLAEAGASFTMAPEVEMQMGHGLPVTGRVLALGKQPSVGIDVESNIGTELLWSARFALQLQRGLDNLDVHRSGKDIGSVSITARQALEWATTEGARTLRMEHRIGSLAPGKQADVILIRTEDLNVFPSFDPAETVLFQSNGSNVDTVIVGGRIVKRHGRLLYGKLQEKKEQLAESGRRLLHDSGLLAS